MKKRRGNALIMIVVMMFIVCIFTSVSAHTANMQMLVTNAHVMNLNGRRLAEGGVHDGAAYLNEILDARRRAASELARGRIISMDAGGLDVRRVIDGAIHLTIPETDVPADLNTAFLGMRGKANVLFKTLFKKYMDDEVRLFLETAAGAGDTFEYLYTIGIDDIHESEYTVAVKIKYADGGFDITAAASNTKTGVINTAAGRASFICGDGAETLSDDGALTIENAGGFRYALVSVKKAFE